jgi:CheY-like chemotaxis protein
MVLIADDDADIRDVLAEILRMRGYEVTTAPDGERALEIIRKEAPCLLLLDLMMPRTSGWEVAARIKADTTLSSIKILIISAGQFEPPSGTQMLRKPLDLGEVLKAARESCRGQCQRTYH